MFYSEENGTDDESSISSVLLFNYLDTHWRIKQLKAAFLHCVRHRCPLVIHGPPGSGRTSMTAAISQFCRSWLSSPHAVVAARVLASSPASMTIEYVLSTICYQLSEVGLSVSISNTVWISVLYCTVMAVIVSFAKLAYSSPDSRLWILLTSFVLIVAGVRRLAP